jgi:hypothetical protein
MVTNGTLITIAKGISGCSKSASLCVGWEAGGESSVGGSAVLPEMKRNDGLGPSTVDVICVTIGSKMRQVWEDNIVGENVHLLA